jgi:hypothetical protein
MKMMRKAAMKTCEPAARLFQHLVHPRENVAQDFGGRPGGINAMHALRAVETQRQFGLGYVNFEALPDDVEVRVSEPGAPNSRIVWYFMTG